MSKHVGIPIKVLHDAEGHTVTVELKTGEVFRGKLDEAEDNMNVHLSNCTKTAKDGRVSTLSKCASGRRAAPPLALPLPSNFAVWTGCARSAQAPPRDRPAAHAVCACVPRAVASCAAATCDSWCCPTS